MKSRLAPRHRVSRGKKLLLTVPALAGAAMPAAQAAIIFTSVNGGSGLTNVANQGLYFSVTGGTAHIGPPASLGDEFYFSWHYGSNLGQPMAFQGSSGSGNYLASSAGYVAKFSAGASIGSGSTFFIYGYMASNGSGPWGGGGSGYIGLQIGGNYGWANVTYTYNTSLTLYSFAYDNTGAAIQAGQTVVPETAETALLGALVAGSGAAFTARRKRKLAKAA